MAMKETKNGIDGRRMYIDGEWVESASGEDEKFGMENYLQKKTFYVDYS